MTRPPVPGAVRFEHLTEALGIGVPRPRLSWDLPPEASGFVQAAYQVEVTGADGAAHVETVESGERVLVPWAGSALRSRDRRTVRVRVRARGAEAGAWSEWSQAAVVETGLLDRDDWVARPVGASLGGDADAQPQVRRVVVVGGELAAARLYATALGLYDITVNGRPVTDDVLAPGWQSYESRLRYRTYDLTAALREGENEIVVALGDGWYRGRLGFLQERAIYGDRLAFLGQLELCYADGRKEVVATDDTWQWRPGSVLLSDLYDGESYDARDPFASSPWRPVDVLPFPRAELVAPTGPPVRRTQIVPAASVFRSPTGRVLVDFGQNLVGWVRMRVRGARGTTVTLRHAEVLEHGELGIRPLRTAEATDHYVLSGEGEEVWEPRFTYHGFRYVEVDGWPGGEPVPGDLEAVVVHDDMRRTGWFTSSDPLLDRLHENVVWGMRGNFVDIPTDCPQRDERLGWTGDIGVFAPTATYLYDCSGMLSAWLRNLTVDQSADGMVPFFVPKVEFPPEVAEIPGLVHSHAAAWGDASVIVPFALYQAFGDEQVLRDQFDSMRSWVDGVERLAGPTRVWASGFQFGDWLDPTAPPESPGDGATDKALVATAYFARSARLLGRIAGTLNEDAAAARYERLADEVADAFRRRFGLADGSGLLTSDTQTAYSLALCFELYDDTGQRRLGGERLKQLVRDSGHVIATGFVGTPLILDALTRADGLDDAYRLLLQTELPSWLYTVQMGGTTIWERWDSMLPDGSINPGEMTSFNHYALGAVADWMHRTVGGLSLLEPGYRRQRFAPRPRAGLTHAATSHLTPYGLASISWWLRGETLEVEVEVPPGTSAVVDFEGHRPFDVTAGRHRFEVSPNFTEHRMVMERA